MALALPASPWPAEFAVCCAPPCVVAGRYPQGLHPVKQGAAHAPHPGAATASRRPHRGTAAARCWSLQRARCRRSGALLKAGGSGRPREARRAGRVRWVPPRSASWTPLSPELGRSCGSATLADDSGDGQPRAEGPASRASTPGPQSTAANTPRARRPRTWWASPTSRTGGRGIELAFQNDLQGCMACARWVRDRLGRVVEDIGRAGARRQWPRRGPLHRRQGVFLPTSRDAVLEQ